MRFEITQEFVKRSLQYNQVTGVFTWLVDRQGHTKAGDALGCKDRKTGYIVTTIGGRKTFCHRLAWFYMTGSWPDGEIDHIDGNRSNNAWSNLRCVDRATNSENLRRPPSHNTSGRIGVSWSKAANKWAASIKVNRKKIHLGLFVDLDEASERYLQAKRELHNGCTL